MGGYREVISRAQGRVSLPHLNRLVDAVQTNCHITDASHAADMTLCIYLLQMREFCGTSDLTHTVSFNDLETETNAFNQIGSTFNMGKFTG